MNKKYTKLTEEGIPYTSLHLTQEEIQNMTDHELHMADCGTWELDQNTLEYDLLRSYINQEKARRHEIEKQLKKQE